MCTELKQESRLFSVVVRRQYSTRGEYRHSLNALKADAKSQVLLDPTRNKTLSMSPQISSDRMRCRENFVSTSNCRYKLAVL